MKKDEFYQLNKSRKKGNGILIFIAVAAIFITGIIYAAKLHSESRYIVLDTKSMNTSNMKITSEKTFQNVI